jgi:NAD(P)-dependent dehydrogenase (short-subunit alcohol dehydrogenase family)
MNQKAPQEEEVEDDRPRLIFTCCPSALPPGPGIAARRRTRVSIFLCKQRRDEVPTKVWFITGASKGFGMELTKAALDVGDNVVATARNKKTIEDAFGKRDRLLTLKLDVTNEQEVKEAVDAALKHFGQIDVLVNNAGRGLVGAVEEVTAEEVRAVFAVNVEGTLNVLRAVLPSMRARKSGQILNLSSVGGFVSWPGWGIYCATKFMVEGFSEALQAELKPLGIKLTIIEPGPFRTDFLDASALERTKNIIGDYGETAGAARQWADSTHNAQPGDPAKAAAAIVKITGVDNPPFVCSWAATVCLQSRLSYSR